MKIIKNILKSCDIYENTIKKEENYNTIENYYDFFFSIIYGMGIPFWWLFTIGSIFLTIYSIIGGFIGLGLLGFMYFYCYKKNKKYEELFNEKKQKISNKINQFILQNEEKILQELIDYEQISNKKLVKIYLKYKKKNWDLDYGLQICLEKMKKIKKKNNLQKEEEAIQLDYKNKMNMGIEKEMNKYQI
jgi:phosphate/sulfate permease